MDETVVMAEMALMVREESRDSRENQVPQARRVPPVVVGWSTPGGGGPPAQAQEELNCCTRDWLLAVTVPTKEVEPTISVCQRTLSTLPIRLETMLETIFMEWSMSSIGLVCTTQWMITMLRVLCATLH